MKYKLLFLLFIITTNQLIFAQKKTVIDSVSIKNGISKPSILSTNPFSIFITRLNHNFKQKASSFLEFDFSIESGNVWGPNVKTYIPKNENIRNELRSIPWFSRQNLYDVETLATDEYEIETDGVIKGFRGHITIPINNNHEFVLGFRSFLLTNGSFPLSSLTNDTFIEFFHNNIAGGSDPFDREFFGYNKAQIKYIDRNGNRVHLNNGGFTFGGLEMHYYYYPKLLNSKKIYLNFGAHAGTNLSAYNSSIDIGISAAGIKELNFNNRNFMLFGFGINAIRKSFIDLKDNNVDFGTNTVISSLETDIEYNFISKGNTIHSFNVSFYIQTSLNKKDEANYAIHVRDEAAFNSWQHGTRHLYRNNDYWTFVYSFTRKIQTSFYLQQDFTVNNNPDLQTGIGIKFGL